MRLLTGSHAAGEVLSIHLVTRAPAGGAEGPGAGPGPVGEVVVGIWRCDDGGLAA